MPDDVVFEAEGETVGEAKWLSLRELERLYPGLDRSQVTFEVLSEGERGLLGVGTAPARVLARLDPVTVVASTDPADDGAGQRVGESDVAGLVRGVLERIDRSLGAGCQVNVRESADAVSATLSGSGIAVLIGKRGKTIDSIQYVVSSIVASASGDPAVRVTIDAAGYRDRRESRLNDLADRLADQVRRTGRPVSLEPMTSTERKIVHLHLKDTAGIETASEGDEPNRYVVISPALDD